MVTGIVAEELLPLLPLPLLPLPLVPLPVLELVAIGLTIVILPSTVLLAGISTWTRSPTTASLWFVAGNGTDPLTSVDHVGSIGVALAPVELDPPAADPLPPEPVPEEPALPAEL